VGLAFPALIYLTIKLEFAWINCNQTVLFTILLLAILLALNQFRVYIVVMAIFLKTMALVS
jgi:hypothetical protein